MKYARSITLAALLAATLAAPTRAALTWNTAGPSNNWSTAAGNENWTGGVVWTNGEDAIFNGTAENVAVTTDNTVDDISFTGSGWYVTNSTGSLTLADSNSDITVTTAGQTARIDETLAGAGRGITKLGAGTLQLFGTHTYNGVTNVSTGTLWLYRGVGMSTSGFVVNSGGTLTFNTWDTLGSMPAGSVNLNGGKLSLVAAGLSGRYGFASTVTVNAASEITVESSGGAGAGSNRSLFFLDNGLQGSADLTITGLTNGLGVSLRNANSTYSGHVTVNGTASATAGTGSGLAIDHTVAMSSADITVNGTLEIGGGSTGLGWASSNATGQTVAIDALGGNGVVVSNRNAAGTRTLSLGNNNGGANFSGQIVDGSNTTLSLVKNGNGTQTLSGPNTYTGTTTINGGVLLVNGSHNGAGGGYTVATGGTLGGTGTINRAITVNAGGKLSPGTSPGTLTVNANVSIAAAVAAINSQSMLFELGSTSDLIDMTNGTAVLSIGSAVLEFDDFAFMPVTGFGPGLYTLFATDQAVSGSLGTNLTGTISGYSATLSLADSNTDVILTVTEVIPAPSAAWGGGLLLAMAACFRRRLV